MKAIILPPRAKAIILLPGAEVKKNAVIKAKIIKEYYYRGNVINESKESAVTKKCRTGRTL